MNKINVALFVVVLVGASVVAGLVSSFLQIPAVYLCALAGVVVGWNWPQEGRWALKKAPS